MAPTVPPLGRRSTGVNAVSSTIPDLGSRILGEPLSDFAQALPSFSKAAVPVKRHYHSRYPRGGSPHQYQHSTRRSADKPWFLAGS